MKGAALGMYSQTRSSFERLSKPLRLSGLVMLFVPAVCLASGDSGSSGTAMSHNSGRLSIEGISASVGEDEPRVLTILPWRSPTLPRRPRAELESSAPELTQPLDPLGLERHREFRRSLGVGDPGATGSGRQTGGRQ